MSAGNSATPPAMTALEGRARGVRAVALDGDDLAHRPPITTRSIPARSARISTRRSRPRATSSATARRLARADLERDGGAGAPLAGVGAASSASDRLEAVGAADERLARLVLA